MPPPRGRDLPKKTPRTSKGRLPGAVRCGCSCDPLRRLAHCSCSSGRVEAAAPVAFCRRCSSWRLSAAPPPLPPPPARLLVDCNQLAVDIDNEIVVVYNFIRDKVGGALALPHCCLVCRWCLVAPAPRPHSLPSAPPQ